MNEEYKNLSDAELDNLITETHKKVVTLHNRQMSIKILKHS